MKASQMKSIIEGLLFASGDEGLEVKQIADVLERERNQVDTVLREMQAEYRKAGRGIQIMEIGGSYQFTTLPEHAPYFRKLATSPTHASLSQSALEVLSIIAYRQPITRIEIEEIRGVKSDHALHRLVAKDLIREVARADVIGRPILYGTTKSFLDYFALGSLDDLPDTDMFANSESLQEETESLVRKWDAEQLTLDDLDETGDTNP